jgi:hypothetical protein
MKAADDLGIPEPTVVNEGVKVRLERLSTEELEAALRVQMAGNVQRP